MSLVQGHYLIKLDDNERLKDKAIKEYNITSTALKQMLEENVFTEKEYNSGLHALRNIWDLLWFDKKYDLAIEYLAELRKVCSIIESTRT